MRAVKLALIFLILLTTCYSTIAVTSQVNSFYGQSNPFNITFMGRENKTYYLSIPIYSYANNISFDVITQSNYFLDNFSRVNNLDLGNGWFNVTGNCSISSNNLNITGTSGMNAEASRIIYNEQLNYISVNMSTTDITSNYFQGLRVYYEERSYASTFLFGVSLEGNQVKFWNTTSGTIGSAMSASSNTYYFIELKNINYTSYTYDLYVNNLLRNTSIKFDDNKNNVTNVSFVNAYGGGTFPSLLIKSINYTTTTKVKTYLLDNIWANSKNTTLINNILLSNCNCMNCSILESDCQVPFKFYYDIPATIQVNLTNATYSYGIDNCSNSFNIPSNATALNVSFFDINNNPYSVNLSTSITYGSNNYYTSHTNINKDTYCVYPNWLNPSVTYLISYTDGVNVYQYNQQSYFNNNTQLLNLYTQSGTSTITITLKDIITQKIIPNILATQYRYINGLPVLMESKYSGVDGKVVFNYASNTQYRFVFSLSNYNTYIWEVNPILSSTYDINLIPSNSLNITSDFGRTYININPPIYYTGTQNVNVTFTSLYNEYTSYSVNISYPGGSNTLSGSNKGGETLSTAITIVNPYYFDQVQFNITYVTPLTGTVYKFYSFDIASGVNNLTMVKNTGIDVTYGMGLFERLIIVLGYVIITMGLCVLVGQELMGLVLALFIEFYHVAIGFIPIWLILPGLLIAVIIVSARSQ